MPGAVKRDIGAPQNFSNGRMHSFTGIVLHVNAANSGDLYNWITGNNGMSCHFQVAKDGTVYQYIDTQYSSWCQIDGNDDYLSVETSGFPNEPLTDAQLASCGRILAYVNSEHNIPLQLAERPGDRGFGWHGMGAAAGANWGHPECPGDIRKAQRADILKLATGADVPLNLSTDDRQFISDQIKAAVQAIHNDSAGTFLRVAADDPIIQKLGTQVDALAKAVAALPGGSQDAKSVVDEMGRRLTAAA